VSSACAAVRADQFVVDACRFENNRAFSFGSLTWGGALTGTGVVTNSTFIGNAAGAGAAAALGHGSSIVNSTIVSNTGWAEYGEGSAILGFGDVSVFNSIVYGNVVYGYDPSPQIYSYTSAVVRYSNVQGGYPGGRHRRQVNRGMPPAGQSVQACCGPNLRAAQPERSPACEQRNPT
jgi:hypothetical protein